MSLNEAKQAAYSAAHRAARQTETMMPASPALTPADAGDLIQMAGQLACAAREIEARLLGVAEPVSGRKPECP